MRGMWREDKQDDAMLLSYVDDRLAQVGRMTIIQQKCELSLFSGDVLQEVVHNVVDQQ